MNKTYRTGDGKIFASFEEARQYVNWIHKISRIILAVEEVTA